CGHDICQLITLVDRLLDPLADTPDARRAPDRGAAVFLDDHRSTDIPRFEIRVTSDRPCWGAAATIASASSRPSPGGQSAKTDGPAPQTAAPDPRRWAA